MNNIKVICDCNEINLNYDSLPQVLIGDMVKFINENVSEILTIYNIGQIEPVNINIYSSYEEFSEVFPPGHYQEWISGCVIDGTIHLLSPHIVKSPKTYMNQIRTLAHEFVHILNRKKRGNKIIKWLDEGTALYFSGQMESLSIGFQEQIKQRIANDNIPDIELLSSWDGHVFADNGGYEISPFMVEYLIETFGIEELMLMISQPELIPSDILEQTIIFFKNKYDSLNMKR